jgi:hypothetical protein
MTRNHVGFARAGSNPADHAYIIFLWFNPSFTCTMLTTYRSKVFGIEILGGIIFAPTVSYLRIILLDFNFFPKFSQLIMLNKIDT